MLKLGPKMNSKLGTYGKTPKIGIRIIVDAAVAEQARDMTPKSTAQHRIFPMECIIATEGFEN